MAAQSILDRGHAPDVLTGYLPKPDLVQSLVDEAHGRFKSSTDGKNSNIHPALAEERRERGPRRARAASTILQGIRRTWNRGE